MDKDEALRLALEALEYPGPSWIEARQPAITAIKAALEAKDEPVAWRAWVSKFPQGTGSDWVYVTKPIMKDSIHNQPLYTTPPQRTWVGLTADEMLEALRSVDAATAVNLLMSQYKMPPTFKVYAEAIEAKLKEKNT